MIHTAEQLEQARLTLEQRSPQALAAFILTLIHEPNGIGNYVHTFIAADDLNAATEIVKDETDSLRKGERDYGCRHRQGFMAVSRLGYILDTIELILLPANPAAAVGMLRRVIEIDAEISGSSHEDGFGVAEAFDRVCELFNVAARSLPFAAVQPIVDRFKSGDECGL